MILSKQEKEAVKMGLPVFTVRTTHSLSGNEATVLYDITLMTQYYSSLMNTTVCVIKDPHIRRHLFNT